MRSVLPSWPPAFRRAAGSASESHSDAAGARAAPEDLQLEQALEQQALEEQALEQAFEQLDQRCHRGCQVNPRRHKEGWGDHCASASGLWRQNDTGSSIRMSGPLQDRQRSREYRWVSFTYRYTLMTLLRRGTKLTSTEQRDLRSCTTVVLRRPPRQNDAPPRAIAPKDWPPMALLGRAARLLPSQCPPGARCLRVACALSPRFRRGNGMMVPVLRRPESPCCQWHHRETCGLANGARA